MTSANRVEIRIARPIGYDDVHPELLAEDAMREGWPYEVVHDHGAVVVVSVDRIEGYERAPLKAVATDAIKASWQQHLRFE